jgi:hypothetical protein
LSSEIHVCPVNGCTVRIMPGKLACFDHWFLIPLKLRAEASAAWAAVIDGVEDERLSHFHAVRALAVASIHAKLAAEGVAP